MKKRKHKLTILEEYSNWFGVVLQRQQSRKLGEPLRDSYNFSEVRFDSSLDVFLFP